MFKKVGKGLKKFLTNTLVGRITDKVVLGGAVNDTSIKTKTTNEGQFDKKEFVLTLITSSLPVLILLALIFGWLDIETVKELVKIFNI